MEAPDLTTCSVLQFGSILKLISTTVNYASKVSGGGHLYFEEYYSEVKMDL